MQVETEIQRPAKQRITRSYSAQERLDAVAAYNQTGNLEKVSEALGIPLSTLAGWTANPNYNSPQNRQNLADKFEFAANLYLDLAVKKSKKSSFPHLMTGAAIAVDKMQLLRGQPTSITENLDRVELLKVLQSALNEGVIDVTPEQTGEAE